MDSHEGAYHGQDNFRPAVVGEDIQDQDGKKSGKAHLDPCHHHRRGGTYGRLPGDVLVPGNRVGAALWKDIRRLDSRREHLDQVEDQVSVGHVLDNLERLVAHTDSGTVLEDTFLVGLGPDKDLVDNGRHDIICLDLHI